MIRAQSTSRFRYDAQYTHRYSYLASRSPAPTTSLLVLQTLQGLIDVRRRLYIVHSNAAIG